MLHHQLHTIERKLGAWMCRDEDFQEHKDNPLDFESKARTFLCFLENVFGRFYEFKTRICDYDDIPETYGADWDRFQKDVCAAVKEWRPFNGICPVMHIQTAVEDRYVIRNVGIRPCAIEQSFFRVLLKHMALSLPPGKELVIKVFGIRVEFVNTVLGNLKEQLPSFTEPRRSKEDRLNFMGHSGKVEVITLDHAHVEALRTLKVPWSLHTDNAFPKAQDLNDSHRANPRRVELLRRMIALAQTQFAEYLAKANDSTNYLPDALNLDEASLWVYKGGLKQGYCPEERRFFARSGVKYAELYLDREDAVRRASIDSLQTRSTIRIEVQNGKYVFFVRPQDFVRATIPESRRQWFSIEKDIQKFIRSLVIHGEKIVEIGSDTIIMTGPSTAVVPYASRVSEGTTYPGDSDNEFIEGVKSLSKRTYKIPQAEEPPKA